MKFLLNTYLVATALSLPVLSLSASATTINFSNPATDEISEINALGLEISGSGAVNIAGQLGIGDNIFVDNGESITFSFLDQAANVGTFSAALTLSDPMGIAGGGSVEAIGTGGSLGVIQIDSVSPFIDITALFGSQDFTSFTYTADEGAGRSISSITFELIAAESVPEPAATFGLLVGFGTCYFALRKRK